MQVLAARSHLVANFCNSALPPPLPFKEPDEGGGNLSLTATLKLCDAYLPGKKYYWQIFLSGPNAQPSQL